MLSEDAKKLIIDARFNEKEIPDEEISMRAWFRSEVKPKVGDKLVERVLDGKFYIVTLQESLSGEAQFGSQNETTR